LELSELQKQLRAQRSAGGRAGHRRLGDVPVRPCIAIGADHGGYALKTILKRHLQTSGYHVEDVGTHGTLAVDYPDLAVAVARLVVAGTCALGIVIDAAGIGSCMAANKVAGIRAATCHNIETARNSREHNNANVLVLGSRFVHAGFAKRIVSAWLMTPDADGRHARRVAKIDALDASR
jgi:ribose 5-phosphate isomerase B